jgi:hypothetical protein
MIVMRIAQAMELRWFHHEAEALQDKPVFALECHKVYLQDRTGSQSFWVTGQTIFELISNY